jgi:hypothetical protein
MQPTDAEITFGIDLASQPENTAICAIRWGGADAEVAVLARGAWNGTPLHDELLVALSTGLWDGLPNAPSKVAIDAPFGWPTEFVEAVASHHERRGWPIGIGSDRKLLERRSTDRFVWQATRKLPLSVSTDRIAFAAMRCAGILGRIAAAGGAMDASRDGSGLVAEVYPDAALRAWELVPTPAGPRQGYKGASPECRQARVSITQGLHRQLGPKFAITDERLEQCAGSDDCLDALVCALLARAARLGLTVQPPDKDHQRRALSEGWIHLPLADSLRHLVGASVPRTAADE